MAATPATIRSDLTLGLGLGLALGLGPGTVAYDYLDKQRKSS
jgi:hypothetical protein